MLTLKEREPFKIGENRIKHRTRKKSVVLNDTTLRDGEQAAGVAFSRKEKIEIARMLDDIGIQEIEAGIPAIGIDERLTIKAIKNLNLNARIIAWCRANLSDIEEAMLSEVDTVNISVPASDIMLRYKIREDRDWALDQLRKTIAFARKCGMVNIHIGAEDASRADMEFLKQIAEIALYEGACRFRFADTLGVMDPFTTYKKIKYLVENVKGMDIEIHAHNDLGMATANTLAGIKAGATSASTTVCGLGERAGNAPMEEVVMALRYQRGEDPQIDTRRFKELSETVSRSAGINISPSKPIVGSLAFTHKAGIHVDGILKSSSNYEFIKPEEVGQCHHLAIGKCSGTASVIYALEQCGVLITPAEAALLVPIIRRRATEGKRDISDIELLDIYHSIHK